MSISIRPGSRKRATHLELLGLSEALHVPIILVGRVDVDILGPHILVHHSVYDARGYNEKGKTRSDQGSGALGKGHNQWIIKGGSEKGKSRISGSKEVYSVEAIFQLQHICRYL